MAAKGAILLLALLLLGSCMAQTCSLVPSTSACGSLFPALPANSLGLSCASSLSEPLASWVNVSFACIQALSPDSASAEILDTLPNALAIQITGGPSGSFTCEALTCYYSPLLSLVWLNSNFQNFDQSVPGFPVSVQSIVFRNSSFASILGGVFVPISGSALSSLTTIEVSYSASLTSIELLAFTLPALPALQILRLNNNNIEYIAPAAFVVPSLTQLSLANNRLTQLPVGLFQYLEQLIFLDLSNNQLSYVPAAVFAGAFSGDYSIPTQSWAPLNLTGPSPYVPQMILTNNPLVSIDPPPFDASNKVHIVLTTATSSPLQLLSCCGLEYLAAGSSQYYFSNNSIFCNRSGAIVSISSITSAPFCPCATSALSALTGGTGVYTPATWQDCLHASQWKLVNSKCVNQPSCPTGQTLQRQYGQSNANKAGVCMAQGQSMEIFETICENCAVPFCTSCPGSRLYCTQCNSSYFLYQNSCYQFCPDGFVPVNGTCINCDQSSCINCSSPTVCTQCAGTAYQNLRGNCVACADENCADCSNDYTSCQSCAPGYFLDVTSGMCAVCTVPGCMVTPASQSTSSTRTGIILGVVLGTVTLVILLVWLRVRYRRRAYVKSYGQRQALLYAHAPSTAVAMDRLWQVSASEMESVENMGTGLFGDILSCRWGQRSVILKRLHVAYDPADDYADRAFERLSGEHRQLNHAHLAQYFGAGIFPEGSAFLIYEMVGTQCVSLAAFLAANTADDARKSRFGLETASGMEYLHRSGLTHGNLKCSNICLSSKQSIKIVDYVTVAATRAIRSPDASAPATRPSFAAPELVDNQSSPAADVFAFGFVLWHIHTQRDPVEYLPSDPTGRARAAALRAGQRPALPTSLAAALQELIESCWAGSPDARPVFSTIVQRMSKTEV